MGVLSLFTDAIYYISDQKHVFIRGKKCSVKYSDNRKYAARVLAVSRNEEILVKLKSTAEGTIDETGEYWVCCSPSELTYAQVSKEMAQDTGNRFLFVDKSVLPNPLNGGTRIRALTVDHLDDLEGFFDHASKFMKLEKTSNMNSLSPIEPLNLPLINPGESDDREESSSKMENDNSTVFVDPRITWTDDERSTVLSAFNNMLMVGKIPSGAQMQTLIYSNSCLKHRTVPQMRSWLHTQKTKKITNASTESSQKSKKKVHESYSDSPKNTISSECPYDLNTIKKILPVSGEIATGTSIETNTDGDDLNNNRPEVDCQTSDVLQALKLHRNISSSETIASKQVSSFHVNNTDTDAISKVNDSHLKVQETILPISDIHNDMKKVNYNATGNQLEQVTNPPPPAAVTGFEALQPSIPDLQAPAVEIMKPMSLPPPHTSDIADSTMIRKNVRNGTERTIVPTLVEIVAKDEYPGVKATQQSVEELDLKKSGYSNSPVPPEKIGETEGTIILTPSTTLKYQKDGDRQLSTNIDGLLQYSIPAPDGIQLLPNVNFSLTETPLSTSAFEKLVDNFNTGISEQAERKINPFHFTVFQDIDSYPASPPGEMHPDQRAPSTTESMVNAPITAKKDPKPRKNWIEKVEIINFPKVKIFPETRTSTSAKRQLRFPNEDSQKIDESPTDALGDPVHHSTMNEPEISPSLKGNIESNREVIQSDRETQWSESDESRDDGDDDYVPRAEPSSDEDGDMDLVSDEEDVVQNKGVTKRNVSRESLNITLGDNPVLSAPDDRELRVDPAASVTKKHFCLYCQKMQSKLARHIEHKHHDEEDVKKFIQLPPKSKERQQIIATIRKNGDYLHNTDKRYNTGKLLVTRRPNIRMKKTAEDYITCGNCKGQYARSDLRHHFRRCTKRDGRRERVAMVKGRKIAARVNERASRDVRAYIFPYMREDEVVRCIRYDLLITIFANKQCQKYGTNHHLYQMIRARLRLLGRFLLTIRSIDNRISEFSDIFNPRFYDNSIEAVRVVAGFDEVSRTFKTPAVASNLGTLLKHVGDCLRSECIKMEHVEQQRRVEDFLKLLSEDFGTSINRVVTETQTRNNRRKEVILPTTEDIKKLFNLITTERCKCLSDLQEGFSFEVWNQLGKMSLLSLQIFNRRRPGETERILLEDFRSYKGLNHSANKEAYNALSEEGKRLAQKYVRFEIRGKLGRGVPVLVDNEVLECLELIISHREQAGVPPKNDYLFGLPSTDKDRLRYHRACDLMREYSTKCGAEIPSALRGTQLRKHIATRCINLNLTRGEVTDIANFMGHHENIHKNIYRQPVLETDIVKISKILNTAQGFGESDDSDDDGIHVPSTSRLSSSRGDIHDEPSTSSNGFTGKSDQSFGHSSLNPATPRRWSENQRKTVLSTFRKKLAAGKIPTGIEMQKVIDSSPCLKGRTVPQLRSWLHTQKKKNSMG
ncbi:uncharacterized protein LOC135171231 isoform X2 [Diachasmimorpha longicaudata]|uniref:uncharacterized protein LOC135171231 isoform X2 n=1 Tax=Diachasmimorpha longicaudata TaxID=58733 RepID=UPI0030B90A76